MLPSCVFVLLLTLLPQGHGHMALQEPPARNVLWRMGYDHLPVHRDDDYLVCVQGPRTPCPPCGDPAEAPRPRPHEGGGKWATGIITRTFTIGDTVPVEVNVTRSHGGFLEFYLCPHNNPSEPVDQKCLDKYPLQIVGQRSHRIKLSAPEVAPYNSKELLTLKLLLPYDVTCDQCVLQMTNTAEEFKPMTVMFRNCADISIIAGSKTHMAGGTPIRHRPFEIHTRTHVDDDYFPMQVEYTGLDYLY